MSQKTYTVPHLHTYYSLLDGLSTPKQIVKRLDKLDIDYCAITDHNSLSGIVQFYKRMHEANKKPILGTEFSICDQHSHLQNPDNKKLHHQLFYAKGKKGWHHLLQLTYMSNQKESFYYKPRLSLEEIQDYAPANIVTATGHLGSTLAAKIVDNNSKTIQSNWKKNGIAFVEYLKSVFGKNNVLLEVQLIDQDCNKLTKQLAKCVREIAKNTKTKCIASTDAHYCEKEQCHDQRVLLCAGMNSTLNQALETGMSFFTSDNYHIPSYNEMLEYGNTEEELENTKILNECSDYDILSKPILPSSNLPQEYTNSGEYLKQLCREGWQEKIQNKIPKEEQQKYVDRIKEELKILESVKLGQCTLSDYFLIVKDIVDYCKSQNWIQSPGRGSAAGSLTSYLLDLTKIDPIKYDLIFSRFYNVGRNTEDHTALPDFDLDTLSMARPKIINYLKNKYGRDRVIQICTFGRLKGRSALKTVLRTYGDIPFSTINELTKQFPEEGKITAELKEERNEHDEQSIIQYTLKHDNNNFLKDYCYIDENNNLQGPLSKRFEQAIRLENCIYSRGAHPAGILILPNKLSSTIPVVYDNKNKQTIGGLDMDDAESIGCVKFDILAISILDKVSGIQQILQNGDIADDD